MSEQDQEQAPPSAETNVGTPIPGEAPPQEQGVAPAYQQPTVSPEVESQARRWGWVPREQWRGASERWSTADEFVRKGKEIVPIARDLLSKSEARVRELEQKIGESAAQFTDRIRRLEGMTQVALNKQRDQLWAQYEGLKAQAAEQADMARYHALTNEQARALQEFQPEAAIERNIRENPTPQPQQQQKLDPEVERITVEWIGRNPWFNRDKALTDAATAIHGDLMDAKPGLSLSENFAETDRALRAAFPHKFGPAPASNDQQPPTQQQAHAPSVEGGGRQPGGSNSRRGWNDINADDRRMAEKSQLRYFLPPGMEPEKASQADMKKARDEYAKDYWEQF